MSNVNIRAHELLNFSGDFRENKNGNQSFLKLSRKIVLFPSRRKTGFFEEKRTSLSKTLPFVNKSFLLVTEK